MSSSYNRPPIRGHALASPSSFRISAAPFCPHPPLALAPAGTGERLFFPHFSVVSGAEAHDFLFGKTRALSLSFPPSFLHFNLFAPSPSPSQPFLDHISRTRSLLGVAAFDCQWSSLQVFGIIFLPLPRSPSSCLSLPSAPWTLRSNFLPIPPSLRPLRAPASNSSRSIGLYHMRWRTMYCPSPSHTPTEGKSHDSLPIPKGQMIHVPILAVNTDKKIWAEDATEFKPERWENDFEPGRGPGKDE
ncbi:hypothetical protein B0H13DRAFT_2567959 [Mycena leptocephala]|nr:hypothetical protein B0H13DRAFT_2567959 [Mycena leptocephala]